ncbi:MAG: nicotinamide-nucleotide amidohydrolase family protein [Planctomycetota bacterium]|nr:nicotinamide-nucleotide amidohydrolase family protein [Planctomycetota bacterium]
MTVGVVLVGDELLSGRRTDANGSWLARRLDARGVALTGLTVVGDDPAAIAEAVQHAATRARCVVVSGGLGPTSDDRTRAGLARALGVALAFDEAAWASVVACLARRGRTPPPGERRQGEVPVGGRWLANPVGIAPGLALTLGDTSIYAFPGVPREWRALCEAHVLPTVVAGEEVVARTLWSAGIPEAEIAARIEPLVAAAGLDLASYPHDGEVELVLRARGTDAASRLEQTWGAVRAALGIDAFVPPAGGGLAHEVIARMRAAGRTLATAESVTGGLVARMLTAVPGASAVLPVGWITYATVQKTLRLGVSAALIERHGVVSEAVARALAEGARATARTDAALATTGVAGPEPVEEPGRPAVAPGTVFVALALAGRETVCLRLDLPFERTLVQRHAALRALDLLRRALADGSVWGVGR